MASSSSSSFESIMKKKELYGVRSSCSSSSSFLIPLSQRNQLFASLPTVKQLEAEKILWKESLGLNNNNHNNQTSLSKSTLFCLNIII